MVAPVSITKGSVHLQGKANKCVLEMEAMTDFTFSTSSVVFCVHLLEFSSWQLPWHCLSHAFDSVFLSFDWWDLCSSFNVGSVKHLSMLWESIPCMWQKKKKAFYIEKNMSSYNDVDLNSCFAGHSTFSSVVLCYMCLVWLTPYAWMCNFCLNVLFLYRYDKWLSFLEVDRTSAATVVLTSVIWVCFCNFTSNSETISQFIYLFFFFFC